MPWAISIGARNFAARTFSPSAVRIMWARNPFARLLSAFLDKAARPERQPAYKRLVGTKDWAWFETLMKEIEGPYDDTPAEFARFVRVLARNKREGRFINNHFEPQVERCGLPRGFQYDFVLRVEDTAVWYADVVRLLGLEDDIASGWGAATSPNKDVVSLLLLAPYSSSCYFCLLLLQCLQLCLCPFNR